MTGKKIVIAAALLLSAASAALAHSPYHHRYTGQQNAAVAAHRGQVYNYGSPQGEDNYVPPQVYNYIPPQREYYGPYEPWPSAAALGNSH
jgi:hypothetical protein